MVNGRDSFVNCWHASASDALISCFDSYKSLIPVTSLTFFASFEDGGEGAFLFLFGVCDVTVDMLILNLL